MARLARTQGSLTPSAGLPLVFAQPNPPITSKFTWAPGVEVLGSGSLLTCYDLEELKFPHVAPRAVLPKMFWKPREEGKGKGLGGPKEKAKGVSPCVEPCDGLLDALRAMDPCDWRGLHDEWRDLMNACKAEGIACEDFVKWSVGDPVYAHDARHIRQEWKSLRAEHGGALYAALKARGIRTQRKGSSLFPMVREAPPSPASPPKTANIIARTTATCGVLEGAVGAQRRHELFNSACVMAEMIGSRQLLPKVAKQLLRDALRVNGLWQENRELCETIIGRAYRHVELKMIGETESAT